MQTITQPVLRGLAQIGRHIHAILLIFFIAAMLCAGFIFLQYGYQASLKEPEVAVRTAAAKENDLRALIEKMKERDASRDTILGRTFQDPFVKQEVAQ